MYKNNFFTNISDSISALQTQAELISTLSTSNIAALQTSAEFLSTFSASALSALQAQTELVPDSINAIAESLQESLYNIAALYNQNVATNFTNQISALATVMIPAIEIPSISLPDINFLKGINFQKEYIELTEDACDSITTLLKSSNTTNNVLLKVSNGKMAMIDFIKSVLIPILAIVLPMLLTIYYHKVDSIESQKQYIEEIQLKEKELQLKEEELCIKEQQLQNDIAEKELLENILIEYQRQSEYLQTLLLESKCPCATPEIQGEAPVPFDEAPGCSDASPNYSGEAPDYFDATDGESDNP